MMWWWVLAGCGGKRVAELENQLAMLTERLEAAEQRAPQRTPERPEVDVEAEETAEKLLRVASGLAASLDYEGAKTRLARLESDYPSTRARRAAQRLQAELKIIGEAAGELRVQHWFQGETTMDAGKATLLVFWEVWCPHCKREVPKLEETYARFRGHGLEVVGITKQTRDVTDERIRTFLEDYQVSYPIAREDGEMSRRFGVRGIPAAAVVKDGQIVWRGHPARLKDSMLEGWLGVEREVPRPSEQGAEGPGLEQEREAAASELLKRANRQVESLDAAGARTTLAELAELYPETRAYRGASRLLEELEVIGRDAGELDVAHWYQGETTFAEARATLLVFWEVWCPHCKREMPKLQSTTEAFADRGLQVVGLTKQTRDVTDEQVRAFIEGNGITYAIAREPGTAMSDRFRVRGIPAAAVVRDGEVVWRGHPARITDAMLEAWLE